MTCNKSQKVNSGVIVNLANFFFPPRRQSCRRCFSSLPTSKNLRVGITTNDAVPPSYQIKPPLLPSRSSPSSVTSPAPVSATNRSDPEKKKHQIRAATLLSLGSRRQLERFIRRQYCWVSIHFFFFFFSRELLTSHTQTCCLSSLAHNELEL